MRTLAFLALATLLLAGCSGGGSDPGATTGQVHEIAMHGAVYEPDRITVAKGDVLRFAAHDVTHSAKTMDGTYDAGDIRSGSEKDVTMSTAGTFVFKCRFHAGMQLTATVTA